MFERTTSIPTPAGDCGDFLCGRQAGLEHQRKPLALSQQRRLGLADHAACDCLLGQARAVDAAAVVGDVDQDLVARLARRDAEQPDLALARLQPLGRLLDAMVDGVADDVGQRIADHLDHLAVELDVAAVDVDQHLLAEFGRQVTDHSRQADEQILDALHPRAGDRVAHFRDDPGKPLECPVDGDVGRILAQPPGKLVPRQHHVGDAAHHPVEQLDRQADRARRGRGRVARLARHRRRGRRLGLAGRAKRLDQVLVVAVGNAVAGLDRGDHLADPVDHPEHRTDQRRIGLATAGADVG
jgi:hypothetical protein